MIAITPQTPKPSKIAIKIFLRCGSKRSISDSPPSWTGFGSKFGLASLGSFLSSWSATAYRDVAQFACLVAWTSRTRWALPAAALIWASVARAEGERALSVGLGWATFSAPGVAMPNMEPPAVSPDIGGALMVSYERAIGTDVALRGELAGGVF